MNILTSSSSDPQIAIVHMATRLADKLIGTHRNRLHELLLDVSNNYDMIAKELIPESVAISIGGARAIIRFASMKLLTKEEYEENITERHRRTGTANALNSGLGTGNSLKKSLDARGEIGWSDEERDLLLELIVSPEFLHPKGSAHPGKPNYNLITDFLNDVFHNGQEIRTVGTVATMRSYFLNKMNPVRNKNRQIQWNTLEAERLKELAGIHFQDNDPDRGVDLVFIAQKLNEEFHQEEFSKDIVIRRPGDCFKKLEHLGVVRAKQRRFPWLDTENKRLLELCDTCIRDDGPQKGSPKYEEIAATLNKEFHSEETIKGNIIRTGQTCSAQARSPRNRKK